jgi:hypothetical protein
MRQKQEKKYHEKPLYQLFYRRGAGQWIPSIVSYDKRSTERDRKFYARQYGEHNVRVDVTDKNGRPWQFAEEPEEEWSED